MKADEIHALIRPIFNKIFDLEREAEELSAVLYGIPPCPQHGERCLSYAVAWIRAKRYGDHEVRSCCQ